MLAEAFADYAVMRHVLGADARYPQRLQRLIHLFVSARTLRDDAIFGILDNRDLCAVATTSTPGAEDAPAWETLRAAVWAELGAAELERYRRCVAAWQPLTPAVPHLHVNMLGVRRAWQGTGLAARLLRHVHALAAQHQLEGVSLTTENPRNVTFYQHMGYDIVGHAVITPEIETWGFFRRSTPAGESGSE